MKNHIFKIWVDSDGDINQGKYFLEYTSLKEKGCLIERVFSNRTKDFAKNPKKIQEILYLDKPDVIITHQENESSIEEPILSLEISEQTPMGQNAYQRFPRAVASAEAEVPFVIIFPYKDWVERGKKETSGWETASPFIFNGLKKISEIYNFPAFSVNWKAGDKKISHKGYKKYDKKFQNLPDSNSEEMKELFKFINLTIENKLNGHSVSKLMENRGVKSFLEEMDEKRLEKGRDFIQTVPSKSGLFIDTINIKKYIKERIKDSNFKEDILPDYIKARDESLIFYSGSKNFRADPYTGTMLVYDYSFCRYGKDKIDRDKNLILHFPNISFKDIKCKYNNYYKTKCPFKPDSKKVDEQYLTLHLRDGCKFTKNKEFRVYFYFADLIILKDAVLF